MKRMICVLFTQSFARHFVLSCALSLALSFALSLTIFPAMVFAAEKQDSADRDLGNDHFTGGCPVRIHLPVAGDLIAAGCSVDVDTSVGGDAALAGGNVRVNGNIGQGLYAAAGQLSINGGIGRNARVAGGNVDFGPKSDVSGNVSIAGGQVTLKGAVKGYVQVSGGEAMIDGAIGGDVEATSGKVELGPNARIGGKLRYTSREELKRDPAAQVQGGVERREPGKGAQVRVKSGESPTGGGWIWTAGLLLLAAVLASALPGFCAGVAESLRTRVGTSFLLGFVALICVPFAALILLVTLVGIPLGLLVMLAYPMLLLVGFVSCGMSIGGRILARVKGEQAVTTLWRIIAAMAGVLLVALLARIPWVGGWIGFAALLAGLGALVLQVPRLRGNAASGA